MWETLQNLVIGLLAPAGIWLGWLLQRRDRISEFSRDTENLRRSKAEEIYAEIEAVDQSNIDLGMSAIEYSFRDGTKMDALIPKLGRLKALINMYFPEATVHFVAYDLALREPIDACVAKISKINEDLGVPVEDRLKSVKAARLLCGQKASMLLIELLANLKRHMNAAVKELLPKPPRLATARSALRMPSAAVPRGK